MKFNYITFMVKNIDKTVDFYQNLAGLQVVRRFNPGMGEIVFMANAADETSLEFIQFQNAQTVQALGMTISFHVEGCLEELRAKATGMGYQPSEIIDRAPKPLHFTFLDPDRIKVEFSL